MWILFSILFGLFLLFPNFVLDFSTLGCRCSISGFYKIDEQLFSIVLMNSLILFLILTIGRVELRRGKDFKLLRPQHTSTKCSLPISKLVHVQNHQLSYVVAKMRNLTSLHPHRTRRPRSQILVAANILAITNAL